MTCDFPHWVQFPHVESLVSTWYLQEEKKKELSQKKHDIKDATAAIELAESIAQRRSESARRWRKTHQHSCHEL